MKNIFLSVRQKLSVREVPPEPENNKVSAKKLSVREVPPDPETN